MVQKLVAIEWMKVRKYRAFWVMLGLFVLGFYGIIHIVFSYKYHQSAGVVSSFLGSVFRYPQVGETCSFLGSFTLLLLGILLINQVTNEISFRTHRQNIIDGLTRVQFINAKWYMVILMAVFAALLHVLFTAIFAAMGEGGTLTGFLYSLKYTFYFMLNSLSWMALALLISIVVKRSGLAISIFMVYTLIIENVLSFTLKQLFHTGIGNYFPINVVDNLSSNTLIPFPDTMAGPSSTVAVVVGCIYLIAFYLVSRKLMVRMDLK